MFWLGITKKLVFVKFADKIQSEHRVNSLSTYTINIYFNYPYLIDTCVGLIILPVYPYPLIN
jgi:hypothetical protein